MFDFAHHLGELLSQPVYLKAIVIRTLFLRENARLKQTCIFFQLHCVREVPVTEVRSQWNSTSSHFGFTAMKIMYTVQII